MRKFKGTHVFVVDATTFPVHRDRLFCGVKNPITEWSRYGLYADLFALRQGDVVFFYQRRIDEPRKERGFRGVYEIISEPFFDINDIDGVYQSQGFSVRGKCPNCGSPFSAKTIKGDEIKKCPVCKKQHGYHILPNRILIKVKEYYENPVDDNTAYINHTNHGMLWTMLFRKIFGPGRERSITHILPEEGEKLTRLLMRINGKSCQPPPSMPYPKAEEGLINRLQLKVGNGPVVSSESILEAWMMQNIDKNIPILTEIVGPLEELEYFGNNVLYGIGGEKVDILCFHNNGVRYKATVMELKKGGIDKKGVEQIEDYPYWVAQLSTANLPYSINKFEIQPVLIGHGTSSEIITDIKNVGEKTIDLPLKEKCKVVVKKPILLEYYVKDGNINFKYLYSSY
uniref:DUF91 domain-containing protein n=1 Tax=candidate division CPR3 bacterium TaxID=2268181 RepID=A0A7C5USP9_UNCC3